MRVHEVVIVVAMLFAGSNLAGSMARRESPLKVIGLQTGSSSASVVAHRPAQGDAGRSGRIAALDSNACAPTAADVAPCEAAGPAGTARIAAQTASRD
ncbi:MAG TPA: hypothetical protein VFJ16_23555 [Longimicrobium sp.]|nr:hypothetical protein [Longimicrobium sp.]